MLTGGELWKSIHFNAAFDDIDGLHDRTRSGNSIQPYHGKSSLTWVVPIYALAKIFSFANFLARPSHFLGDKMAFLRDDGTSGAYSARQER
jgi:hypothetical protein